MDSTISQDHTRGRAAHEKKILLSVAYSRKDADGIESQEDDSRPTLSLKTTGRSPIQKCTSIKITPKSTTYRGSTSLSQERTSEMRDNQVHGNIMGTNEMTGAERRTCSTEQNVPRDLNNDSGNRHQRLSSDTDRGGASPMGVKEGFLHTASDDMARAGERSWLTHEIQSTPETAYQTGNPYLIRRSPRHVGSQCQCGQRESTERSQLEQGVERDVGEGCNQSPQTCSINNWTRLHTNIDTARCEAQGRPLKPTSIPCSSLQSLNEHSKGALDKRSLEENHTASLIDLETNDFDSLRSWRAISSNSVDSMETYLMSHRDILGSRELPYDLPRAVKNKLEVQQHEIEALREENTRLQKCQHCHQPQLGDSTWTSLYTITRGAHRQQQCNLTGGWPIESNEDRSSVSPDDESDVYLDKPIWMRNAYGDWWLKAQSPIPDFSLFIERQRHNNVAFLVHHTFLEDIRKLPDNVVHNSAGASHSLQTFGEEDEEITIEVLCQDLYDAIDTLLKTDRDWTEHWPLKKGLLTNIDVFFYHFGAQFERDSQSLEEKHLFKVQLLMQFVEKHFGDKFRIANALLAQGLINRSTVGYLFAPGNILVQHEKDTGQWKGFLQTSFATSLRLYPNLSVEAVSWGFDGSFMKIPIPLYLPVEELSSTATSIETLSLHPLGYAKRAVSDGLFHRGEIFWRCRKRAYVNYNGPNVTEDIIYTDTRFVIDVATYQKIHGKGGTRMRYKDQLGSLAFASENPPHGKFVYLLPPTIFGFDILEKKWVNLRVDCISEIQWNTKAFEMLELNPKSKRLIKALVNNQIATDQGTDMVKGKGTGLIVLLHGGPGTGKTLTAESVAEIAKRPLYRVTCGDIGTNPKEVEQYLENVFYLGGLWDCVVLLDEADVFLEQRSLANLERNALVSIFLRTLEYYNGILILTSNRVGTFDEAFKSRIQLALYYESLDQSQRKQIWLNFIDHLQSLNVEMETDRIKKYAQRLSEYPMNGRQIRNAITTARQLALFEKEPLNIEHLDDSIEVSGKFDKYLHTVQGEVEDEEWAREEHIR